MIENDDTKFVLGNKEMNAGKQNKTNISGENSNSKQQEKAESPKSKLNQSKLSNSPYSLLVHPPINKKQPNYMPNPQNVEESEYTSEYVLDMPNDQSEKASKTENKPLNDNSKNQINSKQANICTKSEQPKRIELPLTKSPHSLLVHPNKNRQQSPNNNNKPKNLEESETASEHVLEAPSDPSEKGIFTKRFVLAHNQGRKSVQSKQPEKMNPLKSTNKTPSSSLSNPNQIKNQSKVKCSQKSETESKNKQEIQNKQSDKPIITKRFVLAENQPQRNIQSRQQEKVEPIKQPIKKSNSSLSNTNKNKNQINMKCNPKNQEESVYVLTIQEEKPEKSETAKKFTTHCEQTEKKGNLNVSKQQSFSKNDHEDTEFSSDCILEELEEKIENWNKSEYNEFASSSEISFNSSQSNTVMKLRQIGKVESPQSLDKTQSTLLDKLRQQTVTKDDQTNIDESEITTEDDQSEKAIVTEKFLIANIQLQDSINLKQLDNVEQPKSQEKMSCSILAHQNKNDEQSKTKYSQKTTDVSEYRLKIPEEQIENPNVDEKSINQPTECAKSNQPEKVEQPKSSIKGHCSFLLHQHKNQNQSNMKCYRKLTEESEVTSEYILEEPADNQLQKKVATKKFVLSSNQKQEKVEQQISSEISAHPNKNDEQLNTKCDQKAEEESKIASDKAIVTPKFLICNLQTQQDLNTRKADEIIEPMTQSKTSCSHQVSPNKINYQNVNEYNEEIELKTPKKEREKCEQKKQVVNDSKKDTVNETKNQVVNEPKNKVLSEQKKQVVVNETNNQIISEQKNQIVDEQKITQQKKKPFLSTYDPSIFYNDSVDITRCTFEFQNQDIDDIFDVSTPDKSRHLSFIRINKANIDESEYNSEYILKMPNEQPEKSTVTEKSNLPNNQPKEAVKSKQQEKASPSKSPVKKPDSPLSAHPNKSRQPTFRKNNQTSTKESEIACEYILEMPIEQPEIEEQSKPPAKKTDSLPVQTEKNIKSSNIKRNQKTVEESEFASEFILKVPNEQQEKETLTEKFILPNNQPKENTKSKQPEKIEQSKSPAKEPYSHTIQAEKNRKVEQSKSSPTKEPYSLTVKPETNQKTSNIKRNQKTVEESEFASEFILRVPNEQQEKETLTEKFILPNNQPKENTRSKQPEKVDQSKSPAKISCSIPIQAEKSRKPSNIKRNQKATEESEFVSEYILVIPEEKTAKTEDTKTFILPNDQSLQNKISKQPSKQEDTKTFILPNDQSLQNIISKQPSKQEDTKTFILPNDQSLQNKISKQPSKQEDTKTFILPNDQPLQNKISKQPAKTELPKSSNKDSHLMLQDKTKQQTINKRNQKTQEECVCEYILQIPEEQIENAIITKKSTQSKDQAPIVSINNTKNSLQIKQNKNKPETSTQFNQKEQTNEEIKKEPVNDKLNKNSKLKDEVESPHSRAKINQQPITQEPPISPQYHLAELEEQIEKWCRSEYLEFASSSEKIFNSSLSSITPRLTQTEIVEQVKMPVCSLIEIPNEVNLQTITKDDDLLPETTEESYSEKTIVTQKFLLCNLKAQQNLNTQTDEIIEPVIPSKMSCSRLILPNKEGADHQCFEINFLPLSQYDDEIESETLKKETEKCKIKMNIPKSQVVSEQKDQIVNEQNKQVINEQKNKVVNDENKQVIKEQKNKVVSEPKNQIVNEPKNQIVNEQKNQIVNEQKNQIVNEESKQVIRTRKNQVVNEQNKQVIKAQKNQVVNEEKNKTYQKKKPFVSTYDPSIFYNDSIDVSRCTFEFQKHHHIKSRVVSPPPDQMHLTVSLKDIGLEGLDSNNIEKVSELKNKSRIIIHVDGLGEKTRDRIEMIPKSEVVCKLSPYERKDKMISSIKKVEHIDPYYALFSLSDEQNSVVGSNIKPASLLDSTQKAQKIQAIKPKAAPKNCQKASKSGSFSSSYDEYQLSNFVCRSPRRYKSPNNDF